MSLADRIWNPGVSSNGTPPANDFGLWVPGDPIPKDSDWLLIGVASWSRYDRQLVDLLESLPLLTVRVDFFNADHCTSQEAVQDYVPGIGFVHHTPIVGHWQHGQLTQSENGFAARHLIYRILGLDPKKAEEVVLNRPTRVTV